MGHHTRHESTPAGPRPPLSPLTISPHKTTFHHESFSGPLFPSMSPPSSISDPPFNVQNSHRQSLPLQFPPMSPPPESQHNRRESYPGPFPSLPSPTKSEQPLPLNTTRHSRRESYPGPFVHVASSDSDPLYLHDNITRYESDPGLLPSTSSCLDNYLHDYHHHHNQRRLKLHSKENDLDWPFGDLDGLDRHDIRETAYEIFFTACRSMPGFGGRSALTFYSKQENGHGGSGPNQAAEAPTSRVKRALGLKMLMRSSSMSQGMAFGGSGSGSGRWSTPSSPVASSCLSSSRVRPTRPMTMAEIMRLQMGVTEQSDSRLRKTLMRTLVGQLARQAETIILPLELLRHLKPSEFNDPHEYHLWQKRQLKILEAGLLLHPSIPIEKTNTFAIDLRDIIRSAESKPIDTGKNSHAMRTFCNSVVSLSMRSPSVGAHTNICHWANGFPVNIHLYISLLQSIFDVKEETLVLDEVDELLELMKKTWSTLGINRTIHNVCFTWVLFNQYVLTGQTEPDLLCASHALLNEVSNDAKKEKESFYVQILSFALSSMKGWADKRMLNYHDCFQGEKVGQIENLLPLVSLASKILGNVRVSDGEGQEKGDKTTMTSSGDQVDDYIRSSLKNAFEKIMEAENAKSAENEIKREISEFMLQLAQGIEDLAMKERDTYSPVLKKWHSTAAAVAALMLHNCYGHVLRQYLDEMTSLTVGTVLVLQRARKLEDVLVQMVVEDSVDCDDGGKSIVTEMVPYEVDSTITDLMRKWIDESLQKGKECLQRAKEIETWNPKSKSEPYAKSAVELMNLAKKTVQEFFQIPVAITEDLVQELADGLEKNSREYTMFVAACGLKENYIPSLPPLTRCNRNSKFHKLWKIASPCAVSCEDPHIYGIYEANHPHSCTSRGTQRLYIRLNSLHYLLSHIPSLDKSLTLTPGVVPSNRHGSKAGNRNSSYFETANSSILAACQHLAEVASYRLIFLDSNTFFYDSLYVGDVTNARINHALTVLKHNIKLMTAILTERPQPMAVKEVMKASFDAFLMVLLAGGPSRVFNVSDHQSIKEDFENLKKVFYACGEGLIAENVIEKEAEVVEGVIGLMGESTEQLMENFNIVSSETNGVGVIGNGQKLPMPPTTGKWNRVDPNTILRVLCYRNDRLANHFLKRSFHIAKRR